MGVLLKTKPKKIYVQKGDIRIVQNANQLLAVWRIQKNSSNPLPIPTLESFDGQFIDGDVDHAVRNGFEQHQMHSVQKTTAVLKIINILLIF